MNQYDSLFSLWMNLTIVNDVNRHTTASYVIRKKTRKPRTKTIANNNTYNVIHSKYENTEQTNSSKISDFNIGKHWNGTRYTC